MPRKRPERLLIIGPSVVSAAAIRIKYCTYILVLTFDFKIKKNLKIAVVKLIIYYFIIGARLPICHHSSIKTCK